MIDLKDLLKDAVIKRASDIHITVGRPPMIRVDKMLEATTFPILTTQDTKEMIYSILSDTQKQRFERDRELDLSLPVPNVSRFRVNVHYQRGSVEAAFRVIPFKIKSFEELRLPIVLAEFARKQNGLVLVTGPTGVGKTTTLAAMVDLINRERHGVIICIEDPVEFLHEHNKCLVKQREVGFDTLSFAAALKHALRQDPDIILVGEMRDMETIATALTAAETGHLVLSTLHTPNAPQTLDRLIDVFPPEQQEQIKIQLSGCLQGVVSQTLLPRSDAKGLVPAFEIMTGTSAIRSCIRAHKTDQILTVMQTSADEGMVTMGKAIKELYEDGIIDLKTAIGNIPDKRDLEELSK